MQIWTGSKGSISWTLLTFSRYLFQRPRSHATGRRSFRAEWLVHHFLIFGLPVSMFLTDPDVTAVAQTSGLVRQLLHPHEAITLVPHRSTSIDSSLFFDFVLDLVGCVNIFVCFG